MEAKNLRAFWLLCPFMKRQRKGEEEQERVEFAFIINLLFASQPVP